jgi:NAD(P)-dependent dehydrogenase (short-subunit alcohol dehydrogenase family)
MPTVLVTGASRGIGHAIATSLAAGGWDVLAGVRTDADAQRLSASGRLSPVLLDVTDADHLAALEAVLPDRLDALVNNAGVVVSGPMETVSTDDWRHQLDVNVVGQLAVTRAALPALRAASGRIVFVSSVNGRLSMPLIGAYCASKFALEAAADALRMELAPWGIAVSVVEPAQTDTDMWRTADTVAEETEAALDPEHRRLYAAHIAGLKKRIPVSQRMAVPTDRVTAVVEEALTARRPRPRYVVGTASRVQLAALQLLPTAARDRLLRLVAGQP